MKNSNDTIGNRTRDLPACSAEPQPTAPPRAPQYYKVNKNGGEHGEGEMEDGNKNVSDIFAGEADRQGSGSSWTYSKTCLKRNAIVPVFFFPFSQVSVLQRVVF